MSTNSIIPPEFEIPVQHFDVAGMYSAIQNGLEEDKREHQELLSELEQVMSEFEQWAFARIQSVTEQDAALIDHDVKQLQQIETDLELKRQKMVEGIKKVSEAVKSLLQAQANL